MPRETLSPWTYSSPVAPAGSVSGSSLRSRRAGHSVRQMSRRGTGPGGVRGDLATGLDLTTALAGAELVVHAASDPRGDPWQFDVAGTRRLVEAVDRDRLQHLVYISIVGVDRIPYGYYRAKFAAEQILLASGLPVTLLRVTQFHDFVDFLLDTARRGPVLPVPMGWRVQPVDVGEVAEHVAEVCAAAAGRWGRGVRWTRGPVRRRPRPRLGRRPGAGHPRRRDPGAGQAQRRLPGRRRAALRRRPRATDLRPAPGRRSLTDRAFAPDRPRPSLFPRGWP